jgi:hypothetical protein
MIALSLSTQLSSSGLTGRSSSRGLSISSQLLWNTGSSAFADDDGLTMAETPGDVETVIASGVGSKTVIARSEATLTVIASEAKQSISPRKERVDCFVACAPRNDRHDFRSPGHRPYGFTFQTARRVPTRLRDLAARPARVLPEFPAF